MTFVNRWKKPPIVIEEAARGLGWRINDRGQDESSLIIGSCVLSKTIYITTAVLWKQPPSPPLFGHKTPPDRLSLFSKIGVHYPPPICALWGVSKVVFITDVFCIEVCGMSNIIPSKSYFCILSITKFCGTPNRSLDFLWCLECCCIIWWKLTWRIIY